MEILDGTIEGIVGILDNVDQGGREREDLRVVEGKTVDDGLDDSQCLGIRN